MKGLAKGTRDTQVCWPFFVERSLNILFALLQQCIRKSLNVTSMFVTSVSGPNSLRCTVNVGI